MDGRYARQQRLPEVGDAGQARLAAGRARVTAREGGLVALCYLERAGVGTVVVDVATSPMPFPHAAAFRHPEARAAAHGAWTALSTIVTLLEDHR